MDRHIETSHMDITYKCATCEKLYKRKEDLTAHNAEKHSNFLVWKTMKTGHLKYMKTITLLDESGILLEGRNPRYFGINITQKRQLSTSYVQTSGAQYTASATATRPENSPEAVPVKKALLSPLAASKDYKPIEEYHVYIRTKMPRNLFQQLFLRTVQFITLKWRLQRLENPPDHATLL